MLLYTLCILFAHWTAPRPSKPHSTFVMILPSLFDISTLIHTHKAHSHSTNSELITAISMGKLPSHLPHLLTADTQSGGRGQHGRSWVSPMGNVYLSFYAPIINPLASLAPITPHLKRLTWMLSLMVGLFLWQMDSISTLNRLRQAQHLPVIGVKWANDLGFYHSLGDTPTIGMLPFFKLCGILIEPVMQHSTMVGVVIGVGLNVYNSPVIKDGLYQATSLAALAEGISFEVPQVHDLYTPMSHAICQALMYHNMTTDLGGRLSDEFIATFNQAHTLHHANTAIFAQDDMDTPILQGLCTGIAPDGTLMLATASGIRHAFAGMAKRFI